MEENTTIRDIRIAYHSFLLFVAIICAGIVLKLGNWFFMLIISID